MSIDYDELAAAYDGRYQLRDFREVERAVARYVRRGERALEVGCGTGHWLERCERWGVRATGLDPSMAMLRRAAESAPRAGLVRGRAEGLPFRRAVFDRVLVIQVLHHLRDPSAFLSEARRVLRPGGGVVAIALDPRAGVDRWYVYDYFEGTLARDQRRHPAASALRRWLREAGFVDPRTVPAGSVVLDVPARELLEGGGLAKDTSSQLALLSDEAYRRGIERIERELEELDARGQRLRLEAKLHYYATLGTAPA